MHRARSHGQQAIEWLADHLGFSPLKICSAPRLKRTMRKSSSSAMIASAEISTIAARAAWMRVSHTGTN
jgi:hypothetical protein